MEGAKGYPGMPGMPGRRGKPGDNGPIGAPGECGPDGFPGLTGPQGYKVFFHSAWILLYSRSINILRIFRVMLACQDLLVPLEKKDLVV